MDISKALRDLYKEKKRIDRTIKRLEARLALIRPTAPKKRRGRKDMGAAERLLVSARMKAYWAGKRAKPAAPPPEPPVEQKCSANSAV